MGLDMYLFKAEKPSEKELASVNTAEDLWSKGYAWISADDGLDDAEDLLPLCEKKEITFTVVDLEKADEDHGIPDDAFRVFTSDSAEELTVEYALGGGMRTSYTIKKADYAVEKQKEVYITKLTDRGYFRKHYTLSDCISEVYEAATGKPVLNCGFHRLTPEMIKELDEEFSEFKELGLDGEKEDIFYHEWY